MNPGLFGMQPVPPSTGLFGPSFLVSTVNPPSIAGPLLGISSIPSLASVQQQQQQQQAQQQAQQQQQQPQPQQPVFTMDQILLMFNAFQQQMQGSTQH
jgi:hypothetical protein